MNRHFSAIKKLMEGDKLTRFEVMRAISKRILPQYRFKWPQMDWWNSVEFNAYLDRFSERDGMNTDRRWMLRQLLRLTVNVPGDTAECGVYLGAGSYLICQLNQKSKSERKHFVFDSFEGLSAPGENDTEFWGKGDLSAAQAVVQKALSEFPDVEYMKGWIPDRFPEVEDKRFSFVHIDVDLYQPTMDSIAFFYPRLNSGGIIICDDYGFDTCPGATKAVDEFLDDKPESMVALCCGGGFIIKGTETGRDT